MAWLNLLLGAGRLVLLLVAGPPPSYSSALLVLLHLALSSAWPVLVLLLGEDPHSLLSAAQLHLHGAGRLVMLLVAGFAAGPGGAAFGAKVEVDDGTVVVPAADVFENEVCRRCMGTNGEL